MEKEEINNQVVHLETKITSLFGVIDADGNVTPISITFNPQDVNDPLFIRKFTEEAFTRAYKALNEVREKLRCQPFAQSSQT